MSAQMQQWLPWIGIAALAIYLFFPGAVPKIDKARKPTNAGRALIEQARELGIDAAGTKLQDALGQYQASVFFNELKSAMEQSPVIPTPAPAPNPRP